jgi:hypothetical protein
MHQPPITTRKIPGTHFCQRLSRSQDHNVAGRIRSIEKYNDLIRNQTWNLPACSIVRQPTMLSHAPDNWCTKRLISSQSDQLRQFKCKHAERNWADQLVACRELKRAATTGALFSETTFTQEPVVAMWQCYDAWHITRHLTCIQYFNTLHVIRQGLCPTGDISLEFSISNFCIHLLLPHYLFYLFVMKTGTI